MKKVNIYFAWAVMLFTGFIACSQSTNDGQIMLMGTLEHHQWSKSTMSYCAGGSDYWTLTFETQEGDSDKIVLVPNDEAKEAWEGLVDGEFMTVWGEFREVEKNAADSNPMEQRPVGDSFHCTVFDVSEWSIGDGEQTDEEMEQEEMEQEQMEEEFVEEEQESVFGLIEHHRWSKTTISYCAGGSDYWTVSYEGENGNKKRVVIVLDDESQREAWDTLDGKKANLWGNFREVRKEHSNDSNPPSQHPVGDVFTCTVFDVLGWQVMD